MNKRLVSVGNCRFSHAKLIEIRMSSRRHYVFSASSKIWRLNSVLLLFPINAYIFRIIYDHIPFMIDVYIPWSLREKNIRSVFNLQFMYMDHFTSFLARAYYTVNTHLIAFPFLLNPPICVYMNVYTLYFICPRQKMTWFSFFMKFAAVLSLTHPSLRAYDFIFPFKMLSAFYGFRHPYCVRLYEYFTINYDYT